MNNQDRWRILAAALASVLPESRSWSRGATDGSESQGSPQEHWIEVESPIRAGTQRLAVRLRHDGDIQVEYHIAGRRGTPFEALFVVPEGQEVAVSTTVAHFVSDVVQEHLVLAYARGLVGGGRRFLHLFSEQLAMIPPRELSWVTSWLGTFDRQS